MSLGINKEHAESKLILLYILEKLNMPTSNLQITKITLENKYMNYFLLQQFLNELCDNNMLSSMVIEDKTFYSITPNGKQTLDYFVNLIPSGIKLRIDDSITSIRKNIKDESSVTADFTPEGKNEFVVSCKIHEDNFTIIDLKLSVGTKNDARMVCENWKKYSQAIYSEIIDSLTKKRD